MKPSYVLVVVATLASLAAAGMSVWAWRLLWNSAPT